MSRNPQVPEKESLHSICLPDWQQLLFSSLCLLMCVWVRALLLPIVSALQCSPTAHGEGCSCCLHSRHPDFPRSKAVLTQGAAFACLPWSCPVQLCPWRTTVLPPCPCHRQTPTFRCCCTNNSDIIQNWRASRVLPMHRAATPSGVIFH